MKILKLVSLAILLFLCSSCSRTTAKNTADTPFFGYHIPDLPGWQRKDATRKGSVIQGVTFTNVGSGAKSVLDVQITLFGKGETPDDLSSLKRMQTNVDKMTAKIKPGTKFLGQKEVMYQGYPAISTETSDGKSKVTTIIVADGVNTLTLSKMIVGNPVTAELQQKTDVAWETLLKGIQIPHGNTKP